MEWISVNDKLPDNSNWIAVKINEHYSSHSMIGIGRYDLFRKCFEIRSYDGYYSEKHKVTHWVELPN